MHHTAALDAFERILWEHSGQNGKASGLTWRLGAFMQVPGAVQHEALLANISRIVNDELGCIVALVFTWRDDLPHRYDASYARLLEIGQTQPPFSSKVCVVLDCETGIEDDSLNDAIVEWLGHKLRVLKVSLFGAETPPDFRLSCERVAAYLASQWVNGSLKCAAAGAMAFMLNPARSFSRSRTPRRSAGHVDGMRKLPCNPHQHCTLANSLVDCKGSVGICLQEAVHTTGPPGFASSASATPRKLGDVRQAGPNRACSSAAASLEESLDSFLLPSHPCVRPPHTPASSSANCSVRLVSKCSRVAQDGEITPGTRCCMRCPSCRLEVMLDLQTCVALRSLPVRSDAWHKVLVGAWLELSSRRAEGKIFRAEVVDCICTAFCPACRRPITAVLGPMAYTVDPPLPRKSKQAGIGVHKIRRRWCLSLETRRQRRQMLQVEATIADSPCREEGLASCEQTGRRGGLRRDHIVDV